MTARLVGDGGWMLPTLLAVLALGTAGQACRGSSNLSSSSAAAGGVAGHTGDSAGGDRGGASLTGDGVAGDSSSGGESAPPAGGAGGSSATPVACEFQADCPDSRPFCDPVRQPRRGRRGAACGLQHVDVGDVEV
jgi:hypothetical protein